MAAPIAAAVATFLAIVWFIIQKIANRNKKYEEATSEGKKAVHSHNVADLFKSIRNRMLHR